ncbi:hypothetical protein SDC9_108454 [bioreactor metagenome]|uniref:Serine protease n=1 Tax=bioreactor metagenome TaxID=1076179 RepID=A0A645BIM9_9ZZZZ
MRYVKAIVLLFFILYTFTGLVYASSNIQCSSVELVSDNCYGVKDYNKYAGKTSVEEKQSLYSGSGFFITPDVVVTSNHIVKGASRIEVVYNNDIKLSGVIIGRDDASDLALIRVLGIEPIVTPLTLASSSSMRQGSRVYAVGFPLPLIMGIEPKISEGLISGTKGLQGDLRMFQISAPIQPGNSGGPLLNEHAEVVGVVSASLNPAKMMELGIIPQNVNFAVKSNNLCNLIDYCRLDVSFNVLQCNDKILSAADVMDIVKKAVVFITVIK